MYLIDINKYRSNFRSEESFENFIRDEVNPRFAKLARMIKCDIALTKDNKTYFSKVKKEDVIKWIQKPENNEKKLRDLSIGLYSQSTHYRRLINYFAHMNINSAYSLEQYKITINYEDINAKTYKKAYEDHLSLLDVMNIPHEYKKIQEALWTVGVFYGYEKKADNSYFIKKLDPDFCRINGMVDGSYVYQFNFSYFDTHLGELQSYPPEFKSKYDNYKDGKDKKKTGCRTQAVDDYQWQDISPEYSICMKLDETIDYIAPPFIGLFLDIYDIQDYKELKKASEELQNYGLFIGKIPLNQKSDNPDEFLLSLDTAIDFGNKFSSSLPDQVGFALSVFDTVEYSRMADSASKEKNSVSEAEKALWDASGVNQNMFSGEAKTEGTLAFSVRTDESDSSSVNRQFERWVNRKFKYEFENRKWLFAFKMLDVTIFNYKEKFSQYKQSVEKGSPYKLEMMACLGHTPSSVIGKSYIETEILNLNELWIPPMQSSVMSGNSENAPNRPTKEDVNNGNAPSSGQDGE